jgi:hypothetical protein
MLHIASRVATAGFIATRAAIDWTLTPQARNGGLELWRIATIITPKAASGCTAT